MVALLGVHHGDDNFLGAAHEVHSAAHACNSLARDDPVGQIAVLVDLHRAQNGSVDVAAADDGEGFFRTEEVRIRSIGDPVAAAVDDSVIFLARFGLAGQTGEAVLGLQNDVYAFRKEAGAHGRKTDAQVDDVAVMEFLRRSLGDSSF